MLKSFDMTVKSGSKMLVFQSASILEPLLFALNYINISSCIIFSTPTFAYQGLDFVRSKHWYPEPGKLFTISLSLNM